MFRGFFFKEIREGQKVPAYQGTRRLREDEYACNQRNDPVENKARRIYLPQPLRDKDAESNLLSKCSINAKS